MACQAGHRNPCSSSMSGTWLVFTSSAVWRHWHCAGQQPSDELNLAVAHTSYKLESHLASNVLHQRQWAFDFAIWCLNIWNKMWNRFYVFPTAFPTLERMDALFESGWLSVTSSPPSCLFSRRRVGDWCGIPCPSFCSRTVYLRTIAVTVFCCLLVPPTPFLLPIHEILQELQGRDFCP